MHTNLKALVLPMLLLLAPQAGAFDFNRVLHGDYAFTYSRVCAQSPNGFSPQGLALNPISELTSTIEMVQTYNGDGTSSAVGGHALNIINNATNQNELDFTCTGTYQVNNDGSFSEDLNCSGTVVAGPIAGQTFTQPGIHRSGHIGIFAQTLVISNTGSNLESITFSGSGIALARICGRSGTAVRIR
jgi:hypothetical protein